MNPQHAGYQAYKKNKYETASPHKLISLLYTACLQNGNRAKQALVEGKKEEAHTAILKMQDIVYELIACLNEEQGGELSQNLKRIYLYVIDRLVEANLQKTVEPIEEVIELIESIRSAWEQIGKDIHMGLASNGTSV
ncbi:flagellar export chaperone FliS [Xylanibacillus composti]|nr:flagellar export chaperone FliS [Xylanibacillus composti]